PGEYDLFDFFKQKTAYEIAQCLVGSEMCIRDRDERQHSIIVGDSLTSDILGGINAGIATCWFNFRGFDHNPGII
ncbi:HAD hydrolase-like protein, partial [Staphylococcus aureus]